MSINVTTAWSANSCSNAPAQRPPHTAVNLTLMGDKDDHEVIIQAVMTIIVLVHWAVFLAAYICLSIHILLRFHSGLTGAHLCRL